MMNIELELQERLALKEKNVEILIEKIQDLEYALYIKDEELKYLKAKVELLSKLDEVIEKVTQYDKVYEEGMAPLRKGSAQ